LLIRDLTNVWEEFQKGEADTARRPIRDVALVKVIRKYRFAAEEHECVDPFSPPWSPAHVSHRDVLEVSIESEDAKRWPRYTSPEPTTSTSSTIPTNASAEGQNPPPTEATPAPAPAKRKPGPRKPKTILAPLPGTSKAKKITALEKSAMDWKKHVESDLTEKDELEKHRRDGGYLEKQDFLQRVEERKDGVLEMRKGKRRKL